MTPLIPIGFGLISQAVDFELDAVHLDPRLSLIGEVACSCACISAGFYGQQGCLVQITGTFQ